MIKPTDDFCMVSPVPYLLGKCCLYVFLVYVRRPGCNKKPPLKCPCMAEIDRAESVETKPTWRAGHKHPCPAFLFGTKEFG
jgi:hypothetical protein